MKIPLLLAIIDIMGDDWYKVPRAKRELIEEKMESAYKIPFVDSETDRLCEAIGMSHERCKEIQDHCKAMVEKYDDDDLKNVPMMMEEFSSICTTRSELATAMFTYGFNLAINSNPMGKIMAIVAKAMSKDE